MGIRLFHRSDAKVSNGSHPFGSLLLHHLRHTFATLLIQENKENVDLRTVQELLGDESLVTMQVYTHVDFKQKKKAIETFNIF